MDKDLEKKPNKKKKKRKINFIRLISLITAFAVFAGGITAVAAALVVIKTAEPIDPTKISELLDESSFIFDDKGVLIEKISNGEYRSIVPLSQIPEDLQNAVIAVEDERFREHNGVDVKRIFGALWYDIKTLSLAQGASTITMQVRRETSVVLPPKRADRSITGTTLPRRLITPRIKLGIIGISVRLPYSMISLTLRIPTANISPPREKVRYCEGVSVALTTTAVDAPPA